jgi:hypothetical protein
MDRARGPVLSDLVFGAFATIVAFWLTGGLWPHPDTTALTLNAQDQALNEWFLANASRLYAGDFHLVTHLMNAPDGINLMCNASEIALGVIMAPVTLAFGAAVSFAIILTANLAATAIGWYLLFARTLGLHRFGSAVGALFTAFAPGIMSQSNGHIHITAQWLMPPIVWCVVKLSRITDRYLFRVGRLGVLLGGLIAVHVFLGEEVLFIGGIALAIFCLVYGALSGRKIKPALAPLAGGALVAVVVTSALVSYPLWIQFHGPMSVPNGVFNGAFFEADLDSFTSLSPQSLAGDPNSSRLVTGSAEYTSFFGIALVLVALGATLWMWRRAEVVAAAVTAIVMCALSLGPDIIINTQRTTHHGPFKLLNGLPLLDNALPSRFALAAAVPIALILASALHVALTEAQTVRLLVPIMVLAALVPILPKPLPVMPRPAVPDFFTHGYWRTCVPRNGVLVPVPLPDSGTISTDTMRWPAAAGDQFGIPQGWFIAPYAAGGKATVGIYPRDTSQLLADVIKTGAVPPIGDDQRAKAQADITYWHASCVVLADTSPNEAALKSTLDALFGPAQRVDDVWTWKVTP